ncbi:MAG: hypothetical protein DRI24_23355, partial [Deltaproteobacteria bacterium]
PASKAMPHVQVIRQLLGLPSDTEIFPKQVRLSGSSVGNWINIPYFNFKDTVRYAYDNDCNELSLSAFIDLANSNKLTLKEFEDIMVKLPLSQAPPCLQSIYLSGSAGKGERNVFLFNCAVYLKARFKDSFADNLHLLNKHLDEPIDYQRLDTTVIASHNKKTYAYQCRDGILTGYCNKEICKTREFGIESGSISNLTYEKMVQVKSSDPYYLWTVNSQEMTFFNESELMNQNKFRELCLRQLHLVPRRMKDEAWADILNSALENLEIEEVEDDMSSGSLWMSKVGEFLARKQAARPEQINEGLVYYQPNTKKLHFKSAKLLAFLEESMMFKSFSAAKHRQMLKELGALQGRLGIGGGGKIARTWFVKIHLLQKQGLFTEIQVDQVDQKFEPLKFTGEDQF